MICRSGKLQNNVLYNIRRVKMTIQYPTPQSMLVDLDLDKVSLCNQGANSRAHILIAKRKENSDMPKTFEELLKALTPEQADMVNTHIAGIEKAKDDIIKALTEDVTTLTGEVDTLKKSVPTKEEGTEDIMKNASPEIAAYIAKLKGSVDQLVADREEVLAKERFELVKAIPVDEAKLKSVLKSASPAVFEILKAAATAVETTVLDKGKGKEEQNDFTETAAKAYDALDKAAKAIALEKSMTFEQAFTEACVANPEIYAKYVKGDK